MNVKVVIEDVNMAFSKLNSQIDKKDNRISYL